MGEQHRRRDTHNDHDGKPAGQQKARLHGNPDTGVGHRNGKFPDDVLLAAIAESYVVFGADGGAVEVSKAGLARKVSRFIENTSADHVR